MRKTYKVVTRSHIERANYFSDSERWRQIRVIACRSENTTHEDDKLTSLCRKGETLANGQCCLV